MTWQKDFWRNSTRRALAVVACAALLYFAAGGTFLHQHSHGPDNVCHICQALHMPVLMAAGLNPVATPEILAWYTSLPQHNSPSDSFSLQHAGRAPPSA